MKHFHIRCVDKDHYVRSYPVREEEDAMAAYNHEVISTITVRVQKTECYDVICLGEERGREANS